MSFTRLISLVFLSLVAGFLVVFVPHEIAAMVIAILLVFLLSIFFPKTTMAGLALFLPFQKLLAYQLSNIPFLTLAVKQSEEVVILIAVFTIILGRIFAEGRWKKTEIDLPLALLLIVSVASTLKGRIAPLDAAGLDMFLLLKGFFVFYIFYYLRLTEKNIKLISRFFLVIGLTVFFLGIIDLINPVSFRTLIGNRLNIDYRLGIPSVQSIFVHPGAFGWFMAYMACFCYAFFAAFEKRRYLLFTVLFVIGTFLSMRAKPIAGVFVAGFIAFLLMANAKKIKVFFIAGGFVLLFLILFGEKIRLLIEDKLYIYMQAPESYNAARNALYTTSFQIAKDYFPFGSGFATFGGWMARVYYSPLYAEYGISTVWGLQKGGRFLTDTFWPYIVGQFGFLGLGCYVWILFEFFRKSIRRFKTCDSLFLRAFTLGVIMALAEGLVEALAEPVFLTPPQYFFIFAGLGIVSSLGFRSKPEEEQQKDPGDNKI